MLLLRAHDCASSAWYRQPALPPVAMLFDGETFPVIVPPAVMSVPTWRFFAATLLQSFGTCGHAAQADATDSSQIRRVMALQRRI